MSDPTLEIVVDEPGIRVGRWGSVQLVVYTRTPTVEDLHRTEPLLETILEENPESTGILSFVEAGLKLPGQEVRRLAAEQHDRYGPRVRASATVLAGRGFWASAAMSMIAAVSTLRSQPHPAKTFSDLDEAAGWLLAQLPTVGTMRALVDATLRLRRPD